MTNAHVKTIAFQGIDVLDVDVQVSLINGLPSFTVVGLPDKAVGESRERVRAALNALGVSLPAKRITVNLAPADLMKEGSHFDLPIALALLGVMNVIPQEELDHFVALGELGLDGSIRAVAGVLPAAIHANAAGRTLVCPAACGAEAAWAGDVEILAPKNLVALINHIKGTQILTPPVAQIEVRPEHAPDLKDIKGQESAKRALEIAAAGGHNLLMIGPPGSGKSMLAARLPGILPPLSPKEALDVSMIHSIAGLLQEGRLTQTRPFRDPHHSASQVSLVGGGHRIKPGEISLAHHGVLFLDELPEFSRATLESLRQPIETGTVSIARANAHVTFPANVQLIAAMNPCKCGFLGDAKQACGRAPRCGVDYQSKISGPMFDRIDMHIDVPAVSAADLSLPSGSEDSATVRARVAAARDIQRERFKGKNIYTNAQADGELLTQIATPDAAGQKLLSAAADQMNLSARAYHRLLRVARTLADLEGAASVTKSHIAEALTYRRLTPGRESLTAA